MDRQTSLNLDLVRCVAAFGVFLCHFLQLGTSGIPPALPEPLGRLGVIVFFVLSGFVIDLVAHEKHRHFRGYVDARLARLLSVFLPAIALTFVADAIGRQLQPSLYQQFPEPFSWHTALSLPLFVTFLFENSWFSLRWLSNGPMWSIAYEFWYYLLFGIAFYLRGTLRAVLIGLAIALAGYKILVLMPVWLLGVGIRRWRGQWADVPPGARVAGLLAGLTALTLACTPKGFEILGPLRDAGRFLPGGNHVYFLSDYVLAIPVGVVVAALTVARQRASPRWVQVLVKAGAAGSFSLYLFHVPLILLSRSFGWYEPGSPSHWLAAAASVLMVCYALAAVTEARKAHWLARVASVTTWVHRSALRKAANGFERV